MKATKLLAALLSATMTAMTFASLPVGVQAVDTPDEAAVTVDDTEQTTHELNIGLSVTDEDGSTAQNVIVNLYRQKLKWTDRPFYSLDGEKELVASWNTSDINPYQTGNFMTEDNYIYIFESETLPPEYSFYGSDYFHQEIFSKTEGTKILGVKLQNTTDPPSAYPASGKYSLTLKVIDDDTGEPVEGLDVKWTAQDYYGGLVKAEWNTTDTPEKTLDDLDYWFNQFINQCRYSISISNLPDGYNIISRGHFQCRSASGNNALFRCDNYSDIKDSDFHIVENVYISRDPAKTTEPAVTTTMGPFPPPIWSTSLVTSTTTTTPAEPVREADKYKVVCMEDHLYSAIPVNFLIMGFDKEEPDWEISFAGDTPNACSVPYSGNDRFSVVHQSGGNADLIVTFSDGSTYRTTLRFACSTTRPILPGMTVTTTTVTYDQSAYPKTGTCTETVSIIDADTGKPMAGLDCELIDDSTEEVLYKWNTADEPVAVISGLKYFFEKPKSSCQSYTVIINNMPDDCEFLVYSEKGCFPKFGCYNNHLYLRYSESMADNGMTNVDQSIVIKSKNAPATTPSTTSTTACTTGSVKFTSTTTIVETYFTGTHAYPGDLTSTSTTTPTENDTTTTTAIGSGDANADGKITIADAAAILQYLGNSDKYKLTEQGKRNADCDGSAGLTTADAVFIQKKAMESPAE